MKFNKKLKKLIIFCLFLSLPNISITNKLFSKEVIVRLKNDIERPNYLLGQGDKILVKFFQANQFDTNVNVLPDGTINLPRIGSVYVEGLSIEELKEKLTQEFKTILKRPILYVDLINARPIKINITGQVQRPGIYSLDQSNNNKLTNTDGGESLNITSKGWPTLLDALQVAGGVKSDGNLKKIMLIRNDIYSEKNIIYILDYFTPLKTGLNFINPLIFNGDNIRVLKAEASDIKEKELISNSNLSPASISVNVIGEVASPGLKQIKSNSPLINGILSAGSFTNRSNKNYVKLIRLNSNGTVQITKHKFDSMDKVENDRYPNLKDGDTILVGRNFYTKATDSLNTLTKPINPIINSIGLFKIISE